MIYNNMNNRENLKYTLYHLSANGHPPQYIPKVFRGVTEQVGSRRITENSRRLEWFRFAVRVTCPMGIPNRFGKG